MYKISMHAFVLKENKVKHHFTGFGDKAMPYII